MPDYVRGSGQEIPLGDYAPDDDPTTPGIILDANNVAPSMKGYIGRNVPIAIPNGTLPGTPSQVQGSYMAIFPNAVPGFPSTVPLYAVVGGTFYQLQAGGWVNMNGGNAFLAGFGQRVFTQYNNNVTNDIISCIASGDTVLAQGPNGTFSRMVGLPFTSAQTVISVGGFVVFFSGQNWYSSAAGSDTVFTPNIQTLAATGTLYDVPGNVVAAASLYRSIIAFKTGAVWVGTFSGPPFTWTFQLISGQIGTWGQGCVVTLPDSIAFLGTDDFYITTGYTPQRIPNSLKEWFFANITGTALANVQGWYDNLNSIIYWHFQSTTAPIGVMYDRYIAYNARVGRWSTGYLNATLILANAQDDVSPVQGANGGTPEGGYFLDTNNNLMTWDSAAGATPGTAYIKTGYVGDANNLSQLMRFRAKWNTAPTQDFGQAYHVNVLGNTPALDATVVKNPTDDWYNCLQYDRYHQVQFNWVGSGEITAYAYQARVGGTR